jgi:hypothetical protein
VGVERSSFKDNFALLQGPLWNVIGVVINHQLIIKQLLPEPSIWRTPPSSTLTRAHFILTGLVITFTDNFATKVYANKLGSHHSLLLFLWDFFECSLFDLLSVDLNRDEDTAGGGGGGTVLIFGAVERGASNATAALSILG